MFGTLLKSRPAIWGTGIGLFALLCFYCISRHGPELALGAGAGAESTAATLASSTLEARLLDGRVNLSGTLPDQSSKAQVLARAKELYGEGKFVDNLNINSQTAFPTANWLSNALALLPYANRLNNEGGVAMEQATVTVRGMVDNEEIKSRLLTDATTAAGKGVRVEDKVLVKGKISAAQASDFQAKLNAMIAGKIIEFDTNSDTLTDKGRSLLDEMVRVLAQYPGVPVEIGGHTDSRGDNKRNQNLSQRRATTCLRYLAQKGVDAQRLSARGYGADKPVADNATPEGQQRNRRIEFTVQKEGK